MSYTKNEQLIIQDCIIGKNNIYFCPSIRINSFNSYFMKNIILICMSTMLMACGAEKATTPKMEDFSYSVDKFADI